MSTQPDSICLRGMEFFTHHGETEAERAVGIRLHIDVEVRLDLRRVGRTDDLEDSIDYSNLYGVVRDAVAAGRHHLLEAVAESIAQALLRDTRLQSVIVSVEKQPPIDAVIEAVRVCIERTREDITT